MSAQEIIERIMTMHWDIMSCRCWVCEAGRQLGYRPQDGYLDDWRGRLEYVEVEWPKRKPDAA